MGRREIAIPTTQPGCTWSCRPMGGLCVYGESLAEPLGLHLWPGNVAVYCVWLLRGRHKDQVVGGYMLQCFCMSVDKQLIVFIAIDAVQKFALVMLPVMFAPSGEGHDHFLYAPAQTE